MLDNIRIVLVNTSHPGNIGAAARAMKTMGLSRLYLVNPQQFPHPTSTAMASGALDLLDNAIICKTLLEATEDCQLLIGTSARDRSLTWPALNPRECAEKVVAQEKHETAIIFGRERYGLYNEELQLCHYHLQIPANPDYNSLNLGNAVQLIAYEIYVASLREPSHTIKSADFATMANLEGFYQHLERTLKDIQFIKENVPNRIMPRLRRLFNRTQLTDVEINILRGILTAIEKNQ
jgi:tRNA (cytidine32/uridine32-2'-O)-methyltransferase